jgi:PAS domain S-box-containing protein
MTMLNKAARPPEAAPALFRLISDGALSRAALSACGFPLAMLDAGGTARAVTYVNAAFESYFGYRESETLGRSLAALVLRGDEPLLHRLLAEGNSRWQLRAWTQDGALRHVDIALGAVRNAEGRVTNWVVTFADRSEVERLRAELEELRGLAAVT